MVDSSVGATCASVRDRILVGDGEQPLLGTLIRLGDLLKALWRVSVATDFARSFTTFGGTDPSDPAGPLGGFMAGAPHEVSHSATGEPALA